MLPTYVATGSKVVTSYSVHHFSHTKHTQTVPGWGHPPPLLRTPRSLFEISNPTEVPNIQEISTKRRYSGNDKAEVVENIKLQRRKRRDVIPYLAVTIGANNLQVSVSGSYLSTVLRLVPSEPPTAYTLPSIKQHPTPNLA